MSRRSWVQFPVWSLFCTLTGQNLIAWCNGNCSLFYKLRLPVAKPRGGYSPLTKWHDIQMTEILGLVLCWRKVRFAHLPSPKYYFLFFDFGTLKQSDSRSESSCIKVLHPIFLFLVLWSSQICFANLPASKYYILFFDLWYFEAVRFASQIFLHQSTTY